MMIVRETRSLGPALSVAASLALLKRFVGVSSQAVPRET